MTAQLTLKLTKPPAACRQDEQPALQQQRLGNLESSMLKDLPTHAGICRNLPNYAGIQNPDVNKF